MYRSILLTSAVFFSTVAALTGNAWADYTGDAIANIKADEVSPGSSLEPSSADATILTEPSVFTPVNPSAPRSQTATTGTRTGGCVNRDDSPFIFAPASFVGETATALPTFTWSLIEEEVIPVEFRLYALQASEELDLQHTALVLNGSDIVQYQLPESAALTAGQHYLWQIVIHCNPNRPSRSLVYEAEVIFAPPTSTPASVDTEGTSSVEQARDWAEAGYWYDAIAALGSSNQLDVEEFRSVLLNDLARLEAQEEEQTATQTTEGE